jgi:hypothetical protein
MIISCNESIINTLNKLKLAEFNILVGVDKCSYIMYLISIGRKPRMFSDIKQDLKKHKYEDLTFAEHYKKTGKKLIIYTVNKTRCKIEQLSYETTPNLSVHTALFMSMQLPISFTIGETPTYKYMDEEYITALFSTPLPIKDFDDGTNHITAITTKIEVKTGWDIVDKIMDNFTTYVSLLVPNSCSDKCKIINVDVKIMLELDDMIPKNMLLSYNK